MDSGRKTTSLVEDELSLRVKETSQHPSGVGQIGLMVPEWPGQGWIRDGVGSWERMEGSRE